MGFKVNHTARNIDIKKGEREIKKHQEEMRKQRAAQKASEPKETIKLGGVEIVKDQVANYSSYKEKGITIFDIKFKNGMSVQYMDQYDKKMPADRFNAPGRIFAAGTNLKVYNITNGSVYGTEESEKIILEICQNVNVDGKGGNDIYFSSQQVNYSNNSYKMHSGDRYEKDYFRGFENLDLSGFIDEEYSVAFADENYTFRDTFEHRKDVLKRNAQIFETTTESVKDQKNKNYAVDTKNPPDFHDINDKKDDIMEKINKLMKFRVFDKLFGHLEDWEANRIRDIIEHDPSAIILRPALSKTEEAALEEQEKEE